MTLVKSLKGLLATLWFKDNRRNVGRAFEVLCHPLRYSMMLASGTSADQSVKLRTPCGTLAVKLRNHESARTLFSIFVREDYLLSEAEPLTVLDIGANIGLSALYFLSRHPDNRVLAVEPDPANLEFLRENLAPFADRVEILSLACTPEPTETIALNLTTDGKYNSVLPVNGGKTINVQATTLTALLDRLSRFADPSTKLALKIDIEGLELAVLTSVPADELSQLSRIFVEARGIGEQLGPGWQTTVRAGYVEILSSD